MNNRSNDAEFMRFMSRHLVALVVDYESLNDDETVYRNDIVVYSGFIMCLHNRWYWTTAGHCLKDLDKDIRKGEGRLRYNCEFADYFGPSAPHTQGVPFSYEVGCAAYIYDRKAGLDFGLLPLPELHRAGLEKNAIVPITRENWTRQASLTFTHYKMLGFPVQLQSKNGIQPVMIGIDPLSPSEVNDVPTDTQFVGRIPAEVPISIKGMSGGPICGFRQAADGRWYYHVVALQSAWRERSRIVFGCSLPVVAEAAHKALSDVAAR